ncbi:DUF6153 family protein [Saccharothrix deserti]|uniref:DUF6153 family protein n=1 Tax=Saccharothrix deserti TaxID=2593674 RepID=UPI001EE4AD09|nr:DUF6153 family protein [Saccharothrix deserti]
MLHRVRTRASQWALVWAVAFAVVGMHHLGTQESAVRPTAASAAATVVDCCADDASEEHSPGSGGQHDMLHLCLAILAAALGLTLALLAVRGRRLPERFESFATRVTRPRSPPPRPGGASALLANLCVLRL